MFTGIIQAVGRVVSIENLGDDCRLKISAEQLNLDALKLGDSVAVNGVCLTVINLDPIANHQKGFSADVSVETLNCTAFADLKVDDPVNLEAALTPNQPMGGHWVSGHVDGLAEILDIENSARSKVFKFQVPSDLAKYIAVKGSVTLDGVSLTVNWLEKNRFSVNIIPHTIEATNLHLWLLNKKVNLEVDIIARYLERLMGANKNPEHLKNPLSLETLTKAGFVSGQ